MGRLIFAGAMAGLAAGVIGRKILAGGSGLTLVHLAAGAAAVFLFSYFVDLLWDISGLFRRRK